MREREAVMSKNEKKIILFTLVLFLVLSVPVFILAFYKDRKSVV